MYQRCTNSSWCDIQCIYGGHTCAIIVAHATHILWAELGHARPLENVMWADLHVSHLKM